LWVGGAAATISRVATPEDTRLIMLTLMEIREGVREIVALLTEDDEQEGPEEEGG
jgi:hypothetical protein